MSEVINPEQMDLSLHLYPHTTYEDALSMSEHVMKATVLAPELPAPEWALEKELQKVVRGSADAYRNIQAGFGVNGAFGQGMLDLIRSRANKPGRRFNVRLLDVPGTPKWIKQMAEIRSLEDIAVNPTTDSTVELLHERLTRSVELQSAREEVIVDNINNFVRNSMINKGSSRENARLLVSIGFLHFGLAEKLVERGLPAQITPNSYLENGEYVDEAWQQIKAGHTPSRELYLRSFIGLLLRGEAKVDEDNIIQSNDTPQRIRVIRSVVDSVSTSDLETLSDEATKTIFGHGLKGFYIVAQQIMIEYVGQPTLSPEEVASYVQTN